MGRKRRRSASILAALALASLNRTSSATSRSYIGPNNGNFNTAGNWTGSVVPQNGDDVFFGNTNPNNVTGTMDINLNTSTNTLDSLTINSTAFPSYVYVTESAGGALLVTNAETIGTTETDNAFIQNGGTNSAGSLNVGSGSINNTYALSGTSTSLTVLGTMSLGASGSGLFNQTGGTVTVHLMNSGVNVGLVTLGANSSGFGTYLLSGGLLDADNVLVGTAGGALFSVSNGATMASDFITISTTTAANSAIFNFYNGFLQGFNNAYPTIVVGTNGVFNLQTGGTLGSSGTQPPILVNTGGTFNFAGGSFSATATYGGVNLAGGLLQMNGHNGTLPVFQGTGGIVQNNSGTAAVLTVADPYAAALPTPIQYSFAGNLADGGAASFGLTLLPGSGLSLSGSNSYSGPTTVGGVLQAQSTGAFSPSSNYTLAGGTLDATTFNVSVASLAGTSGQVNVGAGGTLTAGSGNLSTTLGAILTGGGVFNKTGTGTMTLTGGGTFAGNMNVLQGAVAVGSLNAIPSGTTLSLAGTSAGLQVNANQTLAGFSTGTLNATTFSSASVLTFGASNVAGTLDAVFSGSGTLVKVGTGTTTIGFGATDTVANTDSALTIAVNAGTLALAKSPGTDAVAGPLMIGGGTVLLTNSNQIDDSSVVTINSGVLDLNGFNETIGGLGGSLSASVILGGGTLTVGQSSNTSFAGSLVGSGSFTKNGAGTLSLSGSAAAADAWTVNGGLLILQGTITPAGFTANGGVLEFNASSVNLANTAIVSNAGGTVEYLAANVSNGFLRGGGAQVILPGGTSSFSGITTFNSAMIAQNGPASLTDYSNGGTFNNNAPLTLVGVVNSTSGIMNVDNAVSTQDFTNDGVMNVAAGATVSNSLSSMYLGGGSRLTIGSIASPGGVLSLQGGTTLEVNGALLVNNGTISGTTDVNFEGLAEGMGTYGAMNVTFGGVFQPGFSSGTSTPSQGATISSLSGDGTVDNQSAGGLLSLNVNAGTVSTFSGVIQNTTGTLALNLNGSGGLTLLTSSLPSGSQSTNSYSGGTTITGGVLTIGSAGALPAGGTVVNNGTFNVLADTTSGNISGNGTLIVGNGATLKIAANTGTSTQISIAIAGTLDLTNNTLHIDYGFAKNDPISSIISYLTSGYNSGTWNGVGINSSAVVSLNAGQSALIYSVGYADGDDGITEVLPGEIVIMPTLAGDAKMQGNIVFGDFQLLSQYFGQSGTTWDEGNFTYGSSTNFGDFQLLSQNFGASSSALTAGEIASLNGFAAQFGETVASNGNGFSLVSVPEPASLAALAAGGIALLGRRRRRQSCVVPGIVVKS
jgi:fibronectin-binding autotransporter adhesin